MEAVQSSMKSNLTKVLERGEKVDALVDKTDDLKYVFETFIHLFTKSFFPPPLFRSSSSMEFAQSSRKLRRALWLQNMKMMLMTGLLVFVRVCVCFLID